MLTKKDLFKIGLTVVLLETVLHWPVKNSTADRFKAQVEARVETGLRKVFYDSESNVINIRPPESG